MHAQLPRSNSTWPRCACQFPGQCLGQTGYRWTNHGADRLLHALSVFITLARHKTFVVWKGFRKAVTILAETKSVTTGFGGGSADFSGDFAKYVGASA